MQMRKILYILYLLALVFITSACQSQESEEEIEIEETDEDTGVIETDEDAIVGDGETGEETVIALSDEDAMRLVEEKLPDITFSAQMCGSLTKDDKDFYLFEITRDGEKLEQLIAVDDESGEIYTYNEKESVISDYSNFEFYDASKDENVDWSGVYSNDKFSVSIDNTDPGNIEYCVRQGQKDIFVNVAYFTDYANAVSETEDYGKIDLQLKNDTLTIKSESECEFSGIYKIELLR